MLVLIEGNEGTGKTTLIKQLSKHFTFITVKYPKGKFDNLYQTLCQFAEADDVFVLDRGFVSDLVYRIRDKCSCQISLYQIAELCDYYKIKIVFCHNENGYKDAMRRGEDNVTLEKDYDDITLIFEKMQTMLELFTRAQTMSYNFRYDDVEEVVNFIKEVPNGV